MGKIILNDSNNNITSSCENNSLNEKGQTKKQEKDEFAGAFPQWDLLPPLQVIKRVRRSL